MRYKNFLNVLKNTGEKMFAKYPSADGCFAKKSNTINCEDNDSAIETEDEPVYCPDRNELL